MNNTALQAPTSRHLSRRLAALVITLVAAALAAPAQSQPAWPSKPIRLIVAGPAGGSADALARVLAVGLHESLGQPVIVESKAGASGAIAINELTSKGKDGYTFLVIQDGALSEAPLAQKVNYDPFKDLTPLAQLTRTGLVFVANKDLPVTNIKDWVEYAKKQPGGVEFASYATGFKAHTSGMLLGQLTGVTMRHVGYKGSPPALADVMGGHIPFMFDGLTTSGPLVKSGKIKALAVAYPTRLSALPDVPTFTEQGYPQLAKPGWFAVWSRPDVPAAIQQKVRAVSLAHLQKESARQQIHLLGMEPGLPVTTDEMVADLKDATQKQAALLKSINYQPDN